MLFATAHCCVKVRKSRSSPRCGIEVGKIAPRPDSTRDKTIDSGSFDRNDWQERDQRSDGAIVLINGENHYGMRFVLSNPRATKSSFLAGFVLALVFGGERARQVTLVGSLRRRRARSDLQLRHALPA